MRDSDGGERRGRWRSQAEKEKEKNARMESSTFMCMHGYIWNEVLLLNKIINGERRRKTLSPPHPFGGAVEL